MSPRLYVIVSLLLGTHVVAAAQDSASRARLYPVKFVCGQRPRAVPGIPGFDAVSPGFYYTAINIHNASADSVRLRTLISTTRPDPVAGTIVPGPTLTLGPLLSLEVDCAEILEAAAHSHTAARGFLKGFVLLVPSGPLDVVAVYTAGPTQAVATMDVERVEAQAWPRPKRDCADLTFGRIDRPAPRNGRTTVTAVVGNIGSADASNIQVYMEDPHYTGANPPDRIVNATVDFLAGGESRTVSMVLPYEVVGNANMAALVLIVDPKNLITECREDNNRRTAGAP